MSRPASAWLRPAGAAAALAFVVWRLGTGPFVDGVRAVDTRALAAAAAIGGVTTLCCAWRWTVVARGLGVDLRLPAAVAAYYRSLFLNLTLPGGVVGDVHRGVRHGRDVRDLGGGLRAVAWERAAGQVVQAVVTLAVLLILPSPVRSAMPLAVAGDVRAGLLSRRALPVVAVTSAAVVAGHAATFVIAARTAGVDAPVSRLLPLGLLAMLAMVLPSVAGWGPREGATAWAFGAAGLGAGPGVATAVVYGVMALVASLPGVLVLAAAWAPRPAPGSAVAVVVRTDRGRDA
jgi:hypothetical protein